MTNLEIAKIFYEVAAYLDMQGIPFEPRAYEKVAEVLGNLGEETADIYKKHGLAGLEAIPGVGKSIAGHIEEIIKTGQFKKYEALKKKTPVKLSELLRVSGLGPKKIKVLYEKLGVRDLKDLAKVAKGGKIRGLAGFGEKSEENILAGVGFAVKSSERMLLSVALSVAEAIIADLKKLKEVKVISEAGSLRRRQETIGDIDVLVASAKPKVVIDYFVQMPNVERVIAQGPTKASVRLRQGFNADLRVLAPASWGSGLQYFTGSKTHNIKTRQIAAKKHLKLNEYGVFRGSKKIAGKSEEEVYKAIGLAYLEPELREDTGEVEMMQNGEKLPVPVPDGALRGDLQVQTSWTDGANTIEEMALAAQAAGLEYIAITDHTRDLAMTGGSDEEKLLRQIEEVKRVNKKFKDFTVLTGAEVNIRKDGTLDIADEVLAKLDVVGISVHSNFKMPEKEMTERIIKAMRNPNADILFHPTGRLIGRREAYAVDMERIIEEASETGTVLEINAFPDRLDLKDEYVRMAVGKGVKLCIDSDAHATAHFQYLRYGIAQARRGWAEASDIINTHPLQKMLSLLKDGARRGRSMI